MQVTFRPSEAMTYGGPTPSPSPRLPSQASDITSSQVLSAGVIIALVGLVMLFFTSGGTSAVAVRWAAFQLWLLRKVAYVLLFLGLILIFDAVVRR